MNELGWGWVPIAIGGVLLLLVVFGLFISMKEDFDRERDGSLGLPSSKWKAFALVFFDYFGRGLSKLVFEALGVLVMLAILVFIFGGFIGLLIIGWERLIEVVMPLAEKYLTTITLHMFV